MEVIENLIRQTAFFQDGIDWRNYVMILVAFIFLYLAIKKGYEPLLLLPIAFGMLLANIYPLIIQDGGNPFEKEMDALFEKVSTLDYDNDYSIENLDTDKIMVPWNY